MKHSQEPSCVSLVFGVLVGSDDFKTVQQLKDETRCNMNQVLAATHSLHKYKAVEVMISGGTTYWYATPETDTRQCHRDFRTPEAKPRKTRKSKRAAA